MNILYAIQGTGNGHLSRARDIIPVLKKYGAVDILISGTESDVDLPYEIKYKFHGLCFVFGKKGGIDYVETYKRSKIKKFFKEIIQLPVLNYDLVFSDFEPVSSWACYFQNKSVIGLSHQVAVNHKSSPKPDKSDIIGKAVLKYYAPATYKFGFHFIPYDSHIFTPVIRQEVRELKSDDKGHITVYLPSFNAKRIIKCLALFPDQRWQVFVKHTDIPYVIENIQIFPINNENFLSSMANASGVLCGAGFETPAEALFLKKKLMVIPMKGQYEQQCNAAALNAMGVPVIKSLKRKNFQKISQWLEHENVITINYPNETDWIIQNIIEEVTSKQKATKIPGKNIDSPIKFRKLLLKKIFFQNK
ncbi:MAG: glycosyl transferase [Flavisolibacter sp.]|nr:glycosyl transferase [Flavisolibacter sp.]